MNENKDKIKLKGEIGIFTCELFAQDKSHKEILSALQNTYNMSVTFPTLSAFSKKNKYQIDQIKQGMLERAIKQVPIASEVTRLRREEALYNVSQKLKGDDDKIEYGLKCLKEAREETKQKDYSSFNLQFNQFNQLTDEQLLEKKEKLEREIVELSKAQGGEYVKTR